MPNEAIETGWFGWNLKPTCPKEMICDYISSGMMIGGLIWLLMVVRWGK